MKYEVFWRNPGYKPRPELKKNIECDYLIVGGGIAGVSTAYFLSKFSNKNIVLIEKHTIGNGATGKASGMLSTRGELDLSNIMEKYGEKNMTKIWKEIHQGLRVIREIIEKERINCDVDYLDALYAGYKNKNYNDVRREFEIESSMEKNTKFLEKESLIKELNSNLFDHGILSINHGISVNPLKFVQNFSKVLDKKGVKIYENTNFIKLSKNNIAETHHGNIKFKNIIFAVDADYQFKHVGHMKTTISVTRSLTKKELTETGLIKKKFVWDSKKNYNYIKLTKDNRILIGSGGIAIPKKYLGVEPHFPHLNQTKKFLKKLFPYLNLKIDYVWSASFGFNDNFFPLFEENKDVYSISGAADQVFCVMFAKHIALKLSGRKSNLDMLFRKNSR